MSLENIQVSTTSDEISLKKFIIKIVEWCRYLLSKWVIIVTVGIIGGGLGYVYAYFKKPIYTAKTTFVLEEGESGGGLGRYAGLASMAGIDLGNGGGGIFQGDNIIELYKSRSMVEKTLLSEIESNGKNQLLIDRYIEVNNLREVWGKKPELKDLQFTSKPAIQAPPNLKPTAASGGQIVNLDRRQRLQDSIISQVVEDINKSYLKIEKPDKNLNILEITVKAKDEVFAKSFNDKIVQNVNDFYVQTKTKKSLENLAILQHQTDSVRNILNGAIYQSAAVVDATPNLNPTRLILRAPAQRSQFNAEINKLVLSELVKNLELSKLSLRKETPLIQIVDRPVYPLNKVEMGKVLAAIVGAALIMFFTILALLFSRYYKKTLNENSRYNTSAL